MNTPTRLAGFGAIAVVVFGAAVVLGRVVGPVDAQESAHDTHADRLHVEPASDAASDATEVPGGLMASQSGHTFTLAAERAEAGRAVPVAFTITGPDGEPVTSYDVEHEKLLHLIAVRRDFTGFQHVHPTLDDGVWRVDLSLTPGSWRLFADFKPTGGPALTLGTDLAVGGSFEPAPPRQETRTATVDGYDVTVAGDLSAGADAKLTLRVSKAGRAVTDLEPYLGAYGHLVALRAGDLAYLHVHPDGEPGDGTTEPGPDVVFHTAVPSAGTYHLYLDFQHDGVVRTAAFTVSAGGDGGTGSGTDSGTGSETDGDHGGTSGHGH